MNQTKRRTKWVPLHSIATDTKREEAEVKTWAPLPAVQAIDIRAAKPDHPLAKPHYTMLPSQVLEEKRRTEALDSQIEALRKTLVTTPSKRDEAYLLETWTKKLLKRYLAYSLPDLFDPATLESKFGHIRTLEDAVKATNINPDFLVCYPSDHKVCECVHFTTRNSAEERHVLDIKRQARRLYEVRKELIQTLIHPVKSKVRATRFYPEPTAKDLEALQAKFMKAAQLEYQSLAMQTVYELKGSRCPFHAVLLNSGILPRKIRSNSSREPVSERDEMKPAFALLRIVLGSRRNVKKHNANHYDDPRPLDPPIDHGTAPPFSRSWSFDELVARHCILEEDDGWKRKLYQDDERHHTTRVTPDYCSVRDDGARKGIDGEGRWAFSLDDVYRSYFEWRSMFHPVRAQDLGEYPVQWTYWNREKLAILGFEEEEEEVVGSEAGSDVEEEDEMEEEPTLNIMQRFCGVVRLAFLRRFVALYQMIQRPYSEHGKPLETVRTTWQDYKTINLRTGKRPDGCIVLQSCDVLTVDGLGPREEIKRTLEERNREIQKEIDDLEHKRKSIAEGV